jgi:hypothetical protein
VDKKGLFFPTSLTPRNKSNRFVAENHQGVKKGAAKQKQASIP